MLSTKRFKVVVRRGCVEAEGVMTKQITVTIGGVDFIGILDESNLTDTPLNPILYNLTKDGKTHGSYSPITDKVYFWEYGQLLVSDRKDLTCEMYT